MTVSMFFFMQINYSALVDVRNIKQYDPDATEAVSNGVNQTPLSAEKDATENMVANSIDNNIDLPKDSNPGICHNLSLLEYASVFLYYSWYLPIPIYNFWSATISRGRITKSHHSDPIRFSGGIR